MYRCFRALALLLLLSPPLAAEEGVIVREAKVYADASSSARQVGTIRAGTRVSIFGRKGGWEEIFAEQPETVGWVRSFQVRAGAYTPQVEAGEEPDSRGFLSGLAAISRKASRFFSTSNSNTGTGTATIGVRGLSEAEIKSAKPDLAELAKMQGFASNQQRMARFQLEGQLSSYPVKHLKPKKESGDKKKSDDR